jgi:hypothetical protein
MRWEELIPGASPRTAHERSFVALPMHRRDCCDECPNVAECEANGCPVPAEPAFLFNLPDEEDPDVQDDR